MTYSSPPLPAVIQPSISHPLPEQSWPSPMPSPVSEAPPSFPFLSCLPHLSSMLVLLSSSMIFSFPFPFPPSPCSSLLTFSLPFLSISFLDLVVFYTLYHTEAGFTRIGREHLGYLNLPSSLSLVFSNLQIPAPSPTTVCNSGHELIQQTHRNGLYPLKGCEPQGVG